MKPTRDWWEVAYYALCVGGPAFALVFMAAMVLGRCR